MLDIKKQIVEELHKPARRSFLRRGVILKGIDDLWMVDLIELCSYSKENKGYKYILAVIDCFSKFAWLSPLKSKSGKEVAAAFEKVLKQGGRKPRNLQSDRGKEFYNSFFQKIIKSNRINHYSTFSNMKACIVERFIRTIKNKMWKQFSLQGTYKWITIYEELVKRYNNTKHRTIHMRPSTVKGKKIEKYLLDNVYCIDKRGGKSSNQKQPKYKVGDFVRISKHKADFAKGYRPSWSTEIFKIDQVRKTIPVTYCLKDKSDQMIAGGFYEPEIQKVKYPNAYLVEKILKRKGDKVLVKWLGFDSKHKSWENKNNVNI